MTVFGKFINMSIFAKSSNVMEVKAAFYVL